MLHNRLPDKLDSNARVEVRVNGVVVGTRRILDLVGDATGTDDGTNDKVTINLSTTGGGDSTNFWEVVAGVLQNIVGTYTEIYLAPDDNNFIDIVGGVNPQAAISVTSVGNVNVVSTGADAGIGSTTGAMSVGAGTNLTLTAGGTIIFSPALDTLLADTGVVAGTYGTSVKIPRFTVDAKGRLSSVTELSVPTPTPDHLVHAILDHYANQGNGTTVETDLYTDTLAANLFANNGDKIEYRAGGTFVNSATATRELKLYFGGTAIFDTGALTISAAASWDLEALFIRVSSSVVRYTIKLNTEFAALSAYTAVGELTGLTLSNTQVVKITGQAAGVGAATNDIVAKVGSAMFWPAV